MSRPCCPTLICRISSTRRSGESTEISYSSRPSSDAAPAGSGNRARPPASPCRARSGPAACWPRRSRRSRATVQLPSRSQRRRAPGPACCWSWPQLRTSFPCGLHVSTDLRARASSSSLSCALSENGCPALRWLLSLQQQDRGVSHHARVVAGGIAGVGVLQQLRLVGSHALGGDHGRHDRRSAAGFPNARRKVARHAEVVPVLERVQGLVVDSHGLVVGVIVRQVGAGDDEGVVRRESAWPAPRPGRGSSRSSGRP